VRRVRGQHRRWILDLAEALQWADPATHYLLGHLVDAEDPHYALCHVSALTPQQVAILFPPARALVEGLRRRVHERLDRVNAGLAARGAQSCLPSSAPDAGRSAQQ